MASPIFLLELIPGFTPLLSSVWPLLQAMPGLPAGLLCTGGLFVLVVKYVTEYLSTVLEIYFWSTVEVADNNDAHHMLLSWLLCQPLARTARSLLVQVDRKLPVPSHEPAHRLPLHYSPSNGSFWFWHRNILFVLERHRTETQSGLRKDKITISCIGRNPRPLLELLEECRQHYLAFARDKTSVIQQSNGGWQLATTRDKRRMDTVVIAADIKKNLLKNIREFLSPGMKSWYMERGLPYRRGYLLHGPPGTGKSSFSLALAGELDLELFILNLSSLNDTSLVKLFTELPERCIVMLEDIDAVHFEGEQIGHVEAHPHYREMRSSSRVSLSNLLNVLDGIDASEGRLLLMTANRIDGLAHALVRPGRADMKVEFGMADRGMIIELFLLMYRNRPQEDTRAQAVKFADQTQEWECIFSPAEIISFLLDNKHSLEDAIAGVKNWMRKLAEKKKLLSVEAQRGNSGVDTK